MPTNDVESLVADFAVALELQRRELDIFTLTSSSSDSEALRTFDQVLAEAESFVNDYQVACDYDDKTKSMALGVDAALELQQRCDAARILEASDESLANRLAGRHQRRDDTLSSLALGACSANNINVAEALRTGKATVIPRNSFLVAQHASFSEDDDDDGVPEAKMPDDDEAPEKTSECMACADVRPCYELACKHVFCRGCLETLFINATKDLTLMRQSAARLRSIRMSPILFCGGPSAVDSNACTSKPRPQIKCTARDRRVRRSSTWISSTHRRPPTLLRVRPARCDCASPVSKSLILDVAAGRPMTPLSSISRKRKTGSVVRTVSTLLSSCMAAII